MAKFERIFTNDMEKVFHLLLTPTLIRKVTRVSCWKMCSCVVKLRKFSHPTQKNCSLIINVSLCENKYCINSILLVLEENLVNYQKKKLIKMQIFQPYNLIKLTLTETCCRVESVSNSHPPLLFHFVFIRLLGSRRQICMLIEK